MTNHLVIEGDPATPLAVRADSIHKRYGKQIALDGLDLAVPEGAVYALVGANGAGKTTLMRILLDLVRPQEGSAEVFGLGVRREGARVRSGIGYVPEQRDWGPTWMPVTRLFRHYQVYYPMWDPEYAAALADRFEIDTDRAVEKLSKGQARRVQIVLALAHRPPLLLLDEPMEGLDPVVRDRAQRILANHLADTGATVLVSTHHVHEVTPLVDHVGVLRRGRLTAQMPTDRLSQDLRRYRFEAPVAWDGLPSLNGRVVERRMEGSLGSWTVWGAEAEVRAALEASGARVREASGLTLEQATLALLSEESGR
jgi:ABC-2 type transport system ATP-binding protein